jgi:hypothetical protein
MTTRDASKATVCLSFGLALSICAACATGPVQPATMRFDPFKRDQVFDRAVKTLSGERYAVRERDRGTGKIVTAPVSVTTQEVCGLGACEVKKVASLTISPAGEAILRIDAWFRPTVRATPEDDVWKPAWTSSQKALIETEAQALLGAMAPDAPEMRAAR